MAEVLGGVPPRLANLRWIEGRNVNIEERWPSGICTCVVSNLLGAASNLVLA
jgi:hypothetical protein